MPAPRRQRGGRPAMPPCSAGSRPMAGCVALPHRQRAHVHRLRRPDAQGGRRLDRRVAGAAVRRHAGASSFTYAGATWTQGLSDWIGSHPARLVLHRRVPATVVRTIRAKGLALTSRRSTHYNTAMCRARLYRRQGQDGRGVQVETRFIIAKLRNRRRSLSPSTLNAAEPVGQSSNRLCTQVRSRCQQIAQP
jgi:hypothetical protein